MDIVYKEIAAPDEKQLSVIAGLWSEAFGDGEDFILDFYENMPVEFTSCIFYEEDLAAMAVILSVGEGYYGYAVATKKAYRKRGLCRELFSRIRERCEREERELFIHPADEGLSLFYRRLGFFEVLSSYEVKTASYPIAPVRRLMPFEYFRIRDLYFGGSSYYPWSTEALSFMEKNGIAYYGAYIDGEECAAAVADGVIIELCAPEYSCGKACSAFLQEVGSFGTVRFLTPASHGGDCAVMSLSGKDAYFNLFFE